MSTGAMRFCWECWRWYCWGRSVFCAWKYRRMNVDQGVQRSSERIRAWLLGHGAEERLFRAGVDAGRIEAVEQALGTKLPADLVALWQLDGVYTGYVLPPEGSCALEDPEGALETRAALLWVAAEEDPRSTELFTPDLLPIAMNGGGDSAWWSACGQERIMERSTSGTTRTGG
ncbi:SMI1/KNR4 family protein [Streptomyces sp. NPDC002520]